MADEGAVNCLWPVRNGRKMGTWKQKTQGADQDRSSLDMKAGRGGYEMSNKKKTSTRKKWTPIPLSRLPLRHRFMFNQVFQQKDILQRFLEKAIGIQIDKMEFIETEKTVENEYRLKSIRLDVCVRGSKQIINVEMQASNRGPLPERGRWHEVTIDRSLNSGESYDALRPLYIIFVCDYDPIENKELNGYAMYTRESHWKENMVPAEDGYHLLVFNSNYCKDEKHCNVDPEILELLDFIRTDDAGISYKTQLARMSVDAVKNVRQDKRLEEVYMSFTDYIYDERKEAHKEGYDEGHDEGYNEGHDEGYNEGSDGLQECIDLLCKGLTEAQIASKMDLSQEKAMRLIRKAREIIHVLSQRNLSAVQ